MRLTIIFAEQLATLEVPDDMELENFMALLQVELPQIEQLQKVANLVFMNGQAKVPVLPGNAKRSLTSLGFKDDDCVYLLPLSKAAQPGPSSAASPGPAAAKSTSKSKVDLRSLISAIKVPGAPTPSAANKPKERTPAERAEMMRKFVRRIFDDLKKDQGNIRSLKLTMPKVADAFEQHEDDFEQFAALVIPEIEKRQRIQTQLHDETSAEAQEFIAQQIRIENIEEQYRYALEHLPEAYIPINLLHIRVHINGVEALAMVDSGAQNSIVSPAIARRCNIYDYIDERFFTQASGIGGSSKIKGRIHSCKVKVGSSYLTSAFDVLDEPRVEILLGLSFLRPNHCVIDLKRNVLVMGDGSETPFLGEEEYRREIARLGHRNMYVPEAVQPAEDISNQPTSSKAAQTADAHSSQGFQVDSGKLAELIAMGMDPDKSAAALRKHHNDLQKAMDQLLNELEAPGPMEH